MLDGRSALSTYHIEGYLTRLHIEYRMACGVAACGARRVML
jgi:hypothetical protein